MVACVNVKYVGKKVNRVRFKPESHGLLNRPEYYLPNALSLWACSARPSADPSEAGVRCLDTVELVADADDLCFAGADILAAALSSGEVRLYRCGSKELREQQRWSHLHPGCPCTAIAARDATKLASVGEHGRLCLLTPGRPEPTRVMGKFIDANSGCPTCLTYVRQEQVIVGNLAGHLQLWDLATPDRRPCTGPGMVRRLVGGLGGSRLGRRGAEEGPLGRRRGGQQVTCLAQHQTQGHLVACGAASGQLSLWDLRQTRLATVTLTAPTQGALAEMLFHPDDGSLLFCAHDGSLLRWASPGGRCGNPDVS
ncbi:hypothetical protein HPB48_005505 [Haemaphysalis longicornis]|uniref:Uncharacterized protein n=1 Tax=Haemaphysalis longicornis TaxID=44386 RepID=A0A9J6H3E2_HAELO|nr:hypothetical protein HPB48_005505 [Haemaphysalis longicornis]